MLIIVFTFFAILFPFWWIFAKAGFSPWLSILMLFPVVNIVMLFFLALAEWPALRQVPGSGSRDDLDAY